MTDFRTPPAQEPGPQPDPMLQPGRRSSGWIWLFAIAMLVAISATLYGINNQEPQTASNEPSATEAQQAPASETTGAAPKEQQADKGDAKAKTDGGNSQASPANSPNNAAPQKDQSGQTNQQQKPQQ